MAEERDTQPPRGQGSVDDWTLRLIASLDALRVDVHNLARLMDRASVGAENTSTAVARNESRIEVLTTQVQVLKEEAAVNRGADKVRWGVLAAIGLTALGLAATALLSRPPVVYTPTPPPVQRVP